MTLLVNVPYIVVNAVFDTLLGIMYTCSYASDRSIFNLIFALATSSQIRSWSGKGVTSFIVFSLRCLPSTTVCSAMFFLCTHNIGAAWSTWIGSHHPARM